MHKLNLWIIPKPKIYQIMNLTNINIKNNMEEDKTHGYISALNRKGAYPKCAICGNESSFFSRILRRGDMEYFEYVCKNCGYIMPFSADVLCKNEESEKAGE
jgi:DNA-directed RNA polymerase subunit M/transcription elongation factor TFIIS